ncbi:VCBS repeat-containing protein [Candidatus Sumerlaeota bacterium]|nr:VCBS repeat-containing protein [Candidatus Sumerlaeota bacterium]
MNHSLRSPERNLWLTTGVALCLAMLSLSSALAGVTWGPQQIIDNAADSLNMVITADLDGDGDEDILANDIIAERVLWWENRLDEVTADFASFEVLTLEMDDPAGMAAGDLDGDNDLDVVVAGNDSNNIKWFENRLDEVTADFAPGQTVAASLTDAALVELGDFDGDLDLDVFATAGASSTWKAVWFENRLDEGTADFGPEQLISSTSSSTSMCVLPVDFDGDTDLDVVVGSTSLLAYENTDGGGTLGAPKVMGSVMQQPQRPTGLHAVNFDGDTDLDLVLASSSDDRVLRVRTNSDPFGTGGWTLFNITDSLNLVLYIDVGDLDGDTDPDVVALGLNPDQMVWYENTNGLGTYGAAQTIDDAGLDLPRSVNAVDLDGDLDLDLVLGSQTDDTVMWYENLGSGTGSPEITVTPASLEFGLADLDEPTTMGVTILNEGDAPLEFTGDGLTLLTEIIPTGFSFTTLPPDTSPIAAGASREVEITFYPDRLGASGDMLSVTTNDGDEPLVNVIISGMGFQDTPTLVDTLTGVASPTPALTATDVNMDGVFDSADVVRNVNTIDNP